MPLDAHGLRGCAFIMLSCARSHFLLTQRDIVIDHRQNELGMPGSLTCHSMTAIFDTVQRIWRLDPHLTILLDLGSGNGR